MYTGLCTSRASTIQLVWSAMQAFLVFNAIAIPIVFGSAQQEIVKFIIALVGFFAHVGFSLAAWYLTRLLWLWDQALRNLEQLDQGTDAAPRVAVFSHPDFARHQERRPLIAFLFPFGAGVALWFAASAAHYLRLCAI
jgi:hypothetical protein